MRLIRNMVQFTWNVVDADVDDDRTWFEPFTTYESGFANRSDDDIRLLELGSEITKSVRCRLCRLVKLTISGKFLVRLWHCVTVASRFLSMDVTGLPTMSLRPSTTILAPAMGTPVDFNR